MSRCSAASHAHLFYRRIERELFDCAGQGRIDVFFLSGGRDQCPKAISTWSASAITLIRRRGVFPGSFGSAYLFLRRVCPRSSCSASNIRGARWCRRSTSSARPAAARTTHSRPGSPIALITNRCLFDFDRTRGNVSVSPASIRVTAWKRWIENTGFDFDRAIRVADHSAPSAETLASDARCRRADARRGLSAIRRKGVWRNVSRVILNCSKCREHCAGIACDRLGG